MFLEQREFCEKNLLTTSSSVIRLVGGGSPHADSCWTGLLLGLLTTLCDMSLFSCFFPSWTGWHISVLADCCGLVQGSSWNSYGKEIQHCSVWRYVGFAWRLNETWGEAGIILGLMLCNLPFRSDWIAFFFAAVPVIACNRGSVRPSWQTTPAYSYHSQYNLTS